MNIELDKSEQKFELIMNELYFYNFENRKCFGQLRVVDEKLTMYNFITKKSDIIEKQNIMKIVNRVELTKMFVLVDFYNKLSSRQKQNDMDVDVDSLIFIEEK